MIDRLADAGIPIDRCCRVLGVARQHYYRVKRKPLTQSVLRRQWLTGLIREVHVTSRGTYGYRRVHAELTMAMGISFSDKTVYKCLDGASESACVGIGKRGRGGRKARRAQRWAIRRVPLLR